MSTKSTDAQKARRAKSWASGEQRKAARREAQQNAQRKNIIARKAGDLTPWEAAKADRLVIRMANRAVQPRGQS